MRRWQLLATPTETEEAQEQYRQRAGLALLLPRGRDGLNKEPNHRLRRSGPCRSLPEKRLPQRNELAGPKLRSSDTANAIATSVRGVNREFPVRKLDSKFSDR